MRHHSAILHQQHDARPEHDPRHSPHDCQMVTAHSEHSPKDGIHLLGPFQEWPRRAQIAETVLVLPDTSDDAQNGCNKLYGREWDVVVPLSLDRHQARVEKQTRGQQREQYRKLEMRQNVALKHAKVSACAARVFDEMVEEHGPPI